MILGLSLWFKDIRLSLERKRLSEEFLSLYYRFKKLHWQVHKIQHISNFRLHLIQSYMALLITSLIPVKWVFMVSPDKPPSTFVFILLCPRPYFLQLRPSSKAIKAFLIVTALKMSMLT